MRSDVPARRGPTHIFGVPLTPNGEFPFDLPRVINGNDRDSAGRGHDLAPGPAQRSAPEPRPCSER
jgi:hypothetical protein